MILRLLHPGRAATGPLGSAAADYRDRVARIVGAEETWVKPVRRGPRDRALASEASRLAKQLKPRERLIALTIDGRPWSSEDVAARLEAWMQMGLTGVAFALGSADGLDSNFVARADERWSFGPLTLPHDLARVVLWEQLYRGLAIVRSLPYHH